MTTPKRHPAHATLMFAFSIASALLLAAFAGLYAGVFVDVLVWGFETGRRVLP